MCSIFAAFVRLGHHGKELYRIFDASKFRGRDSWGLWAYNPITKQEKWISSHEVNDTEPHELLDHPIMVYVGHLRAAPVSEKGMLKPHEVAPHRTENWIISFNGIIANNAQLAQGLGLPEGLDSLTLAALIEKSGFAPAIDQLKGSFAIVAYDKRDPINLHYACNYRPMYVQLRNETIVVTSQSYFAQEQDVIRDRTRGSVPFRIQPYTMGFIDLAKASIHVTASLYPANVTESLYPPHFPKRALAVCSGGLDSSTAAWSMYNDGYEVDFLHFQYGCRASERELQCVKDQADLMGSQVYVIPTDFFKTYGKSSLTDLSRSLTKDKDGEAAAEFGHEWVPARNTIMFALAVGLCEAKGYNYLCLGNNLEESGSHPDNEMELYYGLNKLLPYMVKDGHKLEVKQPVGNLMKIEIVKLALVVGVPLEYTWSCYEGKEKPCGECGSCYNRKRAFQRARIKDPTFKHEWDQEFWHDCGEYK